MKNTIAIFFLFMLFNALGQAPFNFTDYCYSNNKNRVKEMNIDSLENVLVKKINNLRTENGINPLIENDSLSEYSKKWSENMLLQDKIYHSNIIEHGIAAENVYISKSFGIFPLEKEYLSSVTDRIFNSWLKSEKHNQNMLIKNVDEIGISIVLMPDGMVDESSTMIVR
jgi:uncharacterized protein YkwD